MSALSTSTTPTTRDEIVTSIEQLAQVKATVTRLPLAESIKMQDLAALDDAIINLASLLPHYPPPAEEA